MYVCMYVHEYWPKMVECHSVQCQPSHCTLVAAISQEQNENEWNNIKKKMEIFDGTKKNAH